MRLIQRWLTRRRVVRLRREGLADDLISLLKDTVKADDDPALCAAIASGLLSLVDPAVVAEAAKVPISRDRDYFDSRLAILQVLSRQHPSHAAKGLCGLGWRLDEYVEPYRQRRCEAIAEVLAPILGEDDVRELLDIASGEQRVFLEFFDLIMKHLTSTSREVVIDGLLRIISGSKGHKERAAQALGCLGDPRAVPQLAMCARTDSDYVPNLRSETEMSYDLDPGGSYPVRIAAADALRAIGTPDAKAELSSIKETDLYPRYGPRP